MEKETRHSFQKSKFGDSIDMPKNKFGHTKVGDKEEDNILPEERMTNIIEPSGDVISETSVDLDSVLSNMQKIIGKEQMDRQMARHNLSGVEEVIPEGSPVIPIPVMRQKFSVAIDDIDNDTDDLDESQEHEYETEPSQEDNFAELRRMVASRKSTEQNPTPVYTQMTPKIEPRYSKNEKNTSVCTNEQCGLQIPENARFCNHCGNPQFHVLGRHCTNCGHKFGSLEKFCPECGHTR